MTKTYGNPSSPAATSLKAGTCAARSYLYAMGITTAGIHAPLIGVATTWNEAAPCNITLGRQAQVVKKGVASAGGTPRESPPLPSPTASPWASGHEIFAGFA